MSVSHVNPSHALQRIPPSRWWSYASTRYPHVPRSGSLSLDPQTPHPVNATKLFKAVLPVAATLFLCGCPTMHTRYMVQPERLAVGGTYVHPASKVTMPETIAGFQRDAVLRYDADSLDV